MCGFRDHYNYLPPSSQDPPSTRKIKQSIFNEVIKRWKAYGSNPSVGKKQMTARPLEDGIVECLRWLEKYGVQVSPRKSFEIIEGVSTIIDCVLTKKEYPTTLISVKTWLGTDSFRESFGNAYFIKTSYGRRNIRFYIVTLFPFKYISRDWIELAKPFVDEVYSLSETPYIDELLNELDIMYKTPLK